MANPIFQIKQKQGEGFSEHSIGSTFDNVFYDSQTNFTLKDLHDYVVGTSYLYVGDKTPSDPVVKVWYDTTQ